MLGTFTTYNKQPVSKNPEELLGQLRAIFREMMGYFIYPLARSKSEEEFFAMRPTSPLLEGRHPNLYPQYKSLIVRTNRGRVRVRILGRHEKIEDAHRKILETFCGDMIRISAWSYFPTNKGREYEWIELVRKDCREELLRLYGGTPAPY